MAWSVSYDQWFDAGVAFSADQLAAFDREAWSLNHRDDCVEALAVLVRYAELPDMPKPEWTKETVKGWQAKLQFFCIKAEVPWAEPELPGLKTAQGKALTALSVQLEPRSWVGGQCASMEAALRQYVTMVRSIGRPKKAERSFDNKVANAIYQQFWLAGRRLEALDSIKAVEADPVTE